MKLVNSVRGRLALVSAVVIAAALTIAGVALTLLFQSYMERRVAQELRDRLLDVAGAFTINETGAAGLSATPADPRYRIPYGGAYWFAREGGAIVLKSRSLWDARIDGPDAHSDEVVDAVGPEERAVYLLEKRVTFGEGTGERNFTLGVAIDQAEVKALSSSFGGEIATMLAVIGGLLFTGAWLQSRYGLKPLFAIRQQLGHLRQGGRDRLDGPFPEEIEELTHDLNALFAQQKQMIHRARERAGALAHGLKTPMTILYGEARKLDLADQTQTARSIRSQLDLIRQQVDRELTRARAHGATTGIGLHADVSATAHRLVGLMQRMPRGDEINWRLPEPGSQAAMDADDFGEVLGNLLDNARKWAKSAVTIAAADLGCGRVRIAVADDGPGIPDEFRAEAVERGASMGGDGGRPSGLGLAIAAELVRAYGAELAIDTGPLGGARVSFELPGSVKDVAGKDAAGLRQVQGNGVGPAEAGWAKRTPRA